MTNGFTHNRNTDQSTHSSGTINIIMGVQVIELPITETQTKVPIIVVL